MSCGALGWSCEGLVELLEGSLVMLSGLGNGLESEGSTWVVLEPTSPVEARAKIAPELRLPMFQSFLEVRLGRVKRKQAGVVTRPLGEEGETREAKRGSRAPQEQPREAKSGPKSSQQRPRAAKSVPRSYT